MKRGQISVEYLIVVGFIMFIVVSLLSIAFFYTASVQSELKSNQIENFGIKVITAAENVFFSGAPSQVTITVFLPSGITETKIIRDPETGQDFLQIKFESNSGLNTLSYSSDVPLDLGAYNGGYLIISCEVVGTDLGLGRCDQGVKRILIKAQSTPNNVKIQEVS